MSLNVAELGVKVKTTGNEDLEKLNATSGKVGKNFSLLEKVLAGTASVFSNVAIAVTKSNLALIKTTKGITSEQLKFAQSAVKAAEGAHKEALSLKELSVQQNKVLKTASGLQEQRQKETTNRGAAQYNRFVSSNIMAQLQDIVITSQMGMNPLTIAMQQGTQLMSAFAQSKNVLADLAAGFKALLGPVALVTVALTALIAKGIQLVDWVSVGKKALNGLADGLDWVAENAGLVAAAVGVIGAGLLGHLLSIIKWKEAWGLLKNTIESIKWGELKKNLVSIASSIINKWVLIPTLIVAAIEAFAMFPQYSKAAVNGIIEDFVYMINKVIAILKTFTETIGIALASGVTGIMDGSLETALKTFEDTINDSLEEKLISDQTVENLKLKAEGAIDTVGSLVNEFNTGIFNAISKTSDKFREWSKSLGESNKDSKDLQKTIEGLKKEYDNLIISYQTKIDDLAFEKSTRGLTDEQKLIAQINHEYDQQVAKLERKVALKKIDLATFNEEKIKLQELKQGYIESSLEQQKYNESVENFNKVMDYSSSLTKGFFSDLKKGLKDGESAWESFTNSVVNMLDKIQDKIMDLAIYHMFEGLKQGNAASGSSNWLSGIINAGVSWISGGKTGNSTSGAFAAMGGQMGVKPTMTASGGVFSNGVYSSPTVFKFAKGGKFGVMGEAGPEAVMPLRRGPDGSLGVKADGVNGSPVIVNVINNSNAQAKTQQRQTSQGMEIDVMIDEMVGEKISRPGTSSNNALRAFNNRQLITR